MERLQCIEGGTKDTKKCVDPNLCNRPYQLNDEVSVLLRVFDEQRKCST
ncbi:hypothetical protein CEXT_522351, partial [Caerostris extrusa]